MFKAFLLVRTFFSLRLLFLHIIYFNVRKMANTYCRHVSVAPSYMHVACMVSINKITFLSMIVSLGQLMKIVGNMSELLTIKTQGFGSDPVYMRIQIRPYRFFNQVLNVVSLFLRHRCKDKEDFLYFLCDICAFIYLSFLDPEPRAKQIRIQVVSFSSLNVNILREAAKNGIFLVARPLRGKG